MFIKNLLLFKISCFEQFQQAQQEYQLNAIEQNNLSRDQFQNIQTDDHCGDDIDLLSMNQLIFCINEQTQKVQGAFDISSI